MRLALPYAVLAAALGLTSVVACSGGSDSTTNPGSGQAASEPGGDDDDDDGASSSGGSTSSSSSGGSTSSSSGGSTSSSGGSSSGDPPTCTAPAIGAAKTLGSLSAAEKGQLCDFAACPFGGYGKSKSCSGGVTVKSKASQAACTGEPTWSVCSSLEVGDFLACNEKINAEPCDALQTVGSAPECASFKACAFGGQ